MAGPGRDAQPLPRPDPLRAALGAVCGLAPAVASIKREPKPEIAPRAFSKREPARIVAPAPDHMRGPIVVAAATWLRRSNVFNLLFSQIDFDARVIKIPPEASQSGRLMAIPMPAPARRRLWASFPSQAMSRMTFFAIMAGG